MFLLLLEVSPHPAGLHKLFCQFTKVPRGVYFDMRCDNRPLRRQATADPPHRLVAVRREDESRVGGGVRVGTEGV